MKYFCFFSVLVLATVCAGETLQPSRLLDADHISIDLQHDGCMSGYRFIYELTGGSRVTLEIFEVYHDGSSDDTRTKGNARHRIGSLELSPKDTAGLDRLFDFYRLNVHGDSTSVDQLSVEYRKGGKLIGHESFTDSSGVLSALSIPSIVEDEESLRQNSRGVDLKLLRAVVPLYCFNKMLWPSESRPNQALEPTAIAVTPAASHPSRQQ